MDLTLNRANITSRHCFTGQLVLDTALHIGSGREISVATDSPIVRDGLGKPVIPGSSIKGAFRAGVERILPNLQNYSTCQLSENYPGCMSTNKKLSEDYGIVSQAAGRDSALGVGIDDQAKEELAALQRLGHPEWVGIEMSEEHLLHLLAQHLCDTCKTFGSVHLAAVTRFLDLPVLDPWAGTTQVRDGVGIDRDSERAVDQIKFDYEIVPAQTTFGFRLVLENPTQKDLALVCLGLSEFVQGMIPMGGIRSRGLGACHLENLLVSSVDFTNSQQFSDYLLKGWPTPNEAADFLQESLKALSEEVHHA